MKRDTRFGINQNSAQVKQIKKGRAAVNKVLKTPGVRSNKAKY